MNPLTLLELWAPATSPWSAWAKPALFVNLPPELPPAASLAPREVVWLPAASERCALVLDLPGAAPVETGLALVARGYRPVPLFNSCPAPRRFAGLIPTAVDVGPIVAALVSGGPILEAARLPASAPPAFLLDTRRTDKGWNGDDGQFDNRSVVFAADFPSAAFLRGQQIERVLVVHGGTAPIGDDLRHALRHWNAPGLRLDAVSADGASLAARWPGNGFFSELSVRFFAAVQLRRGLRGGFGGFVPEASGG